METKPKKKKGKGRLWLMLGLGAGALYLLTGARKSTAGEPIVTNPDLIKPVDIPAGTVSVAGHYRVITNRRPGLTYDPVTQGTAGGTLFFTASKDGKFTRNFLSEGGKLYAEIS